MNISTIIYRHFTKIIFYLGKNKGYKSPMHQLEKAQNDRLAYRQIGTHNREKQIAVIPTLRNMQVLKPIKDD